MSKKTAAQLNREIDEVLKSEPVMRGLHTRYKPKRANDQIYSLVNNKYFTAIPLDQIYDIVEGAGFSFDPEEKQCILTGRDGKATWHLFDSGTGREVNHMLVMQWHKMDTTGRYEIVAYVS